MAVSAKTTPATIIVFFGAALLLCEGARAQQADRCEGTLCDLYYGARGNAAAPSQSATAAAVPGVPAGATPVTVPSGGVMNWFSRSPTASTTGGSAATPTARLPTPPSPEASATNSYMHMSAGGLLGDHQDRCSGTLCDVYYGVSPSEPKSSQQTAAAEPHVVHRHIVHESETRPKCSSPTADPWHCYR